MNRYALCFAAMLLTLLRAVAAGPGEPVIAFDHYLWNFGKIEEADGAVRHTFRFTNRDRYPVMVISVSSTCHCAVAYYRKQLVQSGDRGSLTVTLDPRGIVGDFDKRLTVTTSAGGNNTTTIYVRGHVVPREKTVANAYKHVIGEGLQLDAEVLYFGHVRQGSARKTEVGYINNSPHPITIQPWVALGGEIFSVAGVPITVPAQGQGRMNVTCNLDKREAWAIQKGELSFTINGKQLSGRLPLSAIGIGKQEGGYPDGTAPKARVNPAFHYFDKARPGSDNRVTVELRNDGKNPLVVHAVAGEKGVTSTLMPDTHIPPRKSVSFEVRVSYPVQAEAGRIVHSLHIVTNDPSAPMASLRLLSEIISNEE